MPPKITTDISQELGFYVYAYVNPRDEVIFYIGKGIGTRATDHLSEKRETRKVDRIRDILAAGLEPRIDIIAYRLRDDIEASRVEAALIELVGLGNLTNEVKGYGSTDNPRRTLADIIMEHAVESAEIIHPSLLIRINREFSYGMNSEELYEITRGIWVIGEKRRKHARLAMAVYAGIIREVYEIKSWHRAGSTPYQTRNQGELAEKREKRWEFVGHLAGEPFRSQYLGRSVGHLFRRGQQSPIVSAGFSGE